MTSASRIFVARAAAVAVGAIAIVLSVALRGYNVAFLSRIGVRSGGERERPALLLALSWRRFSRGGAIAGMLSGLISSLALIALSPVAMGTHAIFPLDNPGLVSIPIGFAGAIVGTLLVRDPAAEAMFDELRVRATTGLGAEV